MREHGNRLISEKHYAADDIQKAVGQLDHAKLSLNGAWDKRNNLLTQCHDLQVIRSVILDISIFYSFSHFIFLHSDRLM